MSTSGETRRDKIERLQREMRLMSSFDAQLSQAIAERVGMHSTDIETMDLLTILGPMTAGELSERTGLTSGATTRLIDRLERAGYVHRRPDSADRRRVIVEPLFENLQYLISLFQPLIDGLSAVRDDLTNDELDVVIDFTRRSNAVVAEVNARLRSGELCD